MRFLVLLVSLLCCGVVFAAEGKDTMRLKMIGRWNMPTSQWYYQFLPNGEALQVDRDNASVRNRGKVEWVDSESAVVRWQKYGARWEVFSAAKGMLTGAEYKNGKRSGNGFILEPIK